MCKCVIFIVFAVFSGTSFVFAVSGRLPHPDLAICVLAFQ